MSRATGCPSNAPTLRWRSGAWHCPRGLREELAELKAKAPRSCAGDLVFVTSRSTPQTRQNVRRRVLAPAIGRANKELVRLEIEPIAKVSPHGLRRPYPSSRAALGDDQVWLAQQIGHTDVTFTLKTYASAVKRRERLAGNHRKAFDEDLDWARMGTNHVEEALEVKVESTA